MTVEQLRDQLIADGIASVRKHEKRPSRLKGGVAGFELCRTLDSPEAFQQVLDDRHRTERQMITKATQGERDPEAYWEYRYATVQVEFVWERLKIAWRLSGPYSARAVLHVAEKVEKGGAARG